MVYCLVSLFLYKVIGIGMGNVNYGYIGFFCCFNVGKGIFDC